MVGRRPPGIGITSVVRGDYQHVGEAQQRQEVGQHEIELLQRFGKSLLVFSMAVQHIEIHQIAEDESTLPLTGCRCQFLHTVGVAFCSYVLADAAAIVNVMNLADSENAYLSFREDV